MTNDDAEEYCHKCNPYKDLSFNFNIVPGPCRDYGKLDPIITTSGNLDIDLGDDAEKCAHLNIRRTEKEILCADCGYVFEELGCQL
jgi:hypothetical protein